MFDYTVVVVGDESEASEVRGLVRSLERSPLGAGLRTLNTRLVPVAESGWNGAAGNGLGTLFALQNASRAVGKDLVKEVKAGKSVLVVHTAGEGTRNLLTRTCKNKAFVQVPGLSLLEGAVKQFQEFAIPSRILVSWADQFLLLEDSPEAVRQCAENAHLLLFGLKLKAGLTEEVAKKYGVQIVRCAEAGEGCELLDFDDTRDYKAVKRKLERQREKGGEARVNLGMFAMSSLLAEKMFDAFSENLKERRGKFNSDALWQLWVSPADSEDEDREDEDGADQWLSGRAERLKKDLVQAEPQPSEPSLALVRSFPLSERTAWLDFGTNAGFYENVMRVLAEDEVGRRLREFLGLPLEVSSSGSVFCEAAEFESGLVKSSVVSNSSAKHAELEQACVLNSRLNRVRGRRCVLYNVVDFGSVEVEDCVLVDVFHPSRGRVRLKMRIGEEAGAKQDWWEKRLPGNDFSLREVAEMLKSVSGEELERAKRRFEEVVGEVAGEVAEEVVERPLKIKPFVEEKPWGYELWSASPRNCCEVFVEGTRLEFTLEELSSLFPAKVLGAGAGAGVGAGAEAGVGAGVGEREEKFPLIVKIIKADENLSVQVHPDDEYARRRFGDAFGKDEAWQVLEASAGAKIYLGFRDFLSKEEFKKAVKSKDFISRLNAFDAQVGETYYIPAGVVHALGAGTKVYEVSTASERTFRIFDYGRGRELHLEDAARVLKFGVEERGEGLKKAGKERLVLRKFKVRGFKVRGGEGEAKVFLEERRLRVLTCVRGRVRLKTSGGAVLSLTPFETVLLPACLGDFELRGEGEGEEAEVVCAKWSVLNGE